MGFFDTLGKAVDKAKEYATKKYEAIKSNTGDESFQFLEISKSIRSKIQSIGR